MSNVQFGLKNAVDLEYERVFYEEFAMAEASDRTCCGLCNYVKIPVRFITSYKSKYR
jgi:hypothetical protein